MEGGTIISYNNILWALTYKNAFVISRYECKYRLYKQFLTNLYAALTISCYFNCNLRTGQNEVAWLKDLQNFTTWTTVRYILTFITE